MEWTNLGKPRTEDAKAFKHNERQEGDEYFCPKCSKRWDIHDDAPDCI